MSDPVQVFSQSEVDIVRQVRAGQRIVAREQMRAALMAMKRGLLTAEDIMGACELMVEGAIADTRAYHRILPLGKPPFDLVESFNRDPHLAKNQRPVEHPEGTG